MIRIISDNINQNTSIISIIEQMFYEYKDLIESYKYIKNKSLEFGLTETEFENNYTESKKELFKISSDLKQGKISEDDQANLVEALFNQNKEMYEYMCSQEKRIYTRELEKFESENDKNSLNNLFYNL